MNGGDGSEDDDDDDDDNDDDDIDSDHESATAAGNGTAGGAAGLSARAQRDLKGARQAAISSPLALEHDEAGTGKGAAKSSSAADAASRERRAELLARHDELEALVQSALSDIVVQNPALLRVDHRSAATQEVDKQDAAHVDQDETKSSAEAAAETKAKVRQRQRQRWW